VRAEQLGGPNAIDSDAVVDNLKSQGHSRLASMPVRPQFNVTELAAADKQAYLETERLRHKALAAKSVVELAREKTPPPLPPPHKPQATIELFALRVAVGKRACSRDLSEL
jgi:hypothetical protein